MRRASAILLFLLCISCSGRSASPVGPVTNETAQPSSTVVSTPTDTSKAATVYITDTGEKYHRDGCRYLKTSKISISLKEAIRQGYEPCKVCSPPRETSGISN